MKQDKQKNRPGRGSKTKKKQGNIILGLLKNWKLSFGGAVLFGLCSGGFGTLILGVVSEYGNGNTGTTFFILPPLIFFITLMVLRFLSSVFSKLLLIRLSQGVVCKLRVWLTRRVLDSSLRRVEQLGIARILACLTDDVFNISLLFGYIPVLAINVAIVAACLVYLGILSWPLFLITIGFIFLGVSSYRLIAIRGVKCFERARQKENLLLEHFKTATEGFKELKINRDKREEFFTRHLSETAHSHKQENVAAFSAYAVADGWGELLFFIPVGATLFWLAGFFNLASQQTITYVMIILYLISPVGALVALLPYIGKAAVAARNIQGLSESLQAEATDLEVEEELPHVLPDGELRNLEVKGLAYRYPGEGNDGFKVGPVDFSIATGEVVFIIGGNGSGKSSFVKLLTGIYTPEEGSFLLNGKIVSRNALDWYRQHFSVVFSDSYLSPYLLGVSAEKINREGPRLLEKFGLEEKVSILDNRFSTIDLSGGQRKRLALVAAILEDKPVYVLDEWAADQDPVFKALFYQELIPWLAGQGKAVVAVTHDDRYFHLADRIIKFDCGCVFFEKESKTETVGAL